MTVKIGPLYEKIKFSKCPRAPPLCIVLFVLESIYDNIIIYCVLCSALKCLMVSRFRLTLAADNQIVVRFNLQKFGNVLL